MPVVKCILCHGPIHFKQAELSRRDVPVVGDDCREWLARGIGLDGIAGLAFSLEQTLMIYCLEAAVEAGYSDGQARLEADRMIGITIHDLCNQWDQRLADMPIKNPTTPLPNTPEMVS